MSADTDAFCLCTCTHLTITWRAVAILLQLVALVKIEVMGNEKIFLRRILELVGSTKQ